MSSNIVNSQLGQSSSPQNSKQMSISMPTNSTNAEESSNTTPQSYSCSASSGSSTISNNTQLEITQQPQQPQPQQKPVIQPPNSPSRAKKLVDKFATLSPRIMKNKSDRQLIVETSYCNRNPKKDGAQSEQRPNKAAESVKHSKKKKRAPINITEGMSRADIFAANVASAVDAAEDADEEEDYIYSNDHSRTPSLTSLSSGMPQLQTFSYPHIPSDNNYGYPYHMPPNMYGAIPNSHRSYNNYLHRPPLYGYYNSTSGSETNDVASNQFNRGGSQNNFSNPNTYKPTGVMRVMRSSLPDMSQYVFPYKKGYPNYGSSNYSYNTYNDWYGDDERLPLFAPNYETRQRQSCFPTTSSLTVIIVFLLASFYLLYFASTRPLVDVSIIGISDILAADKELIFNIHVKGRNYGLWNVEISRSDLTVFATPVPGVPGGIPGGPGSHWDDVKDVTNEPITPSELGSILLFDEPLVFASGFNRSGVVSETSVQARLRNPGGKDDKDGQERWSYIVKRPYNLTVRGVFKYSLPFSKDRAVRVCYVAKVDNGSDSNMEKDDKLTSSNDNIIQGACGDWEKEQDMSDE
uniref:Vacuolar segregation protein 7 n=1 Tax=Anthurium amnicola TaxID=1678845 RepID=A0A1D1YB46_9ARAE